MSTYTPEEVLEQLGGLAASRLAGELLTENLPLNAHSNAAASSLVAKSGPGVLFGFTAYSNNAAAQFIQLHDAQVLPADGVVPEVVFRVPATSHLPIAYVVPGRVFTRGIVVCNSSTFATKTIGAADCFFDVQYV